MKENQKMCIVSYCSTYSYFALASFPLCFSFIHCYRFEVRTTWEILYAKCKLILYYTHLRGHRKHNFVYKYI